MEEKVLLAALHLEDTAQLWYMRIHKEEGAPSWRRFSELLNTRFGPPLRSHPLGELTTCRRTGAVTEYQDRFLELLARAGTLTENQQVQLFTVGLGEPLSLDVQLQNPQTLETAMSLARAYERRELAIQAAKRPRRGILPTPPAPAPRSRSPPQLGSSSSTPAPPTVNVAGRTIKHLSPEEMDARRRDGLCFNCNEKYVRGHNKVCAHLFFLELQDGYEDETLEPDADDKEEPKISLHAIAGVSTSETMQVSVLIGGATLRAHLDSGSTHNFISEEAAARTSLRYQLRTDMRVTVANGERVPCLGVFRNATFMINGEQFSGNFFVLPLVGYDVVFGRHWLASLGPILWDFGRLTMFFWSGDHQVQWCGMVGPEAHGSTRAPGAIFWRSS
jgi:hypothetical protein